MGGGLGVLIGQGCQGGLVELGEMGELGKLGKWDKLGKLGKMGKVIELWVNWVNYHLVPRRDKNYTSLLLTGFMNASR